MYISRYVCLFMIYSFFGWIYETTYCTLKNGKWENRGFLYGPACPIYGTGAVAISLVAMIFDQNGVVLSPTSIFVISVVGSAIMEYTTSWFLEKMFHALWWDYSDLPFNLNGRISLFTSLGFGIAGLLVLYYIVPFTESVMDYVPLFVMELLALLLIALFSSDLTLTVSSLLHFDEMVIRLEDNFNKNMESFVENVVMSHAGSLNSLTRSSVLRIKKFRGITIQNLSVRNQLMTAIKKGIWTPKRRK